MFRESLDYPTRPPNGGRSVLYGGLLLLTVGGLVAVGGLDLSLAPLALLAVVPWLMVRGYYVRVVRTTIGRGSTAPAPPPFSGIGGLFRDGITAVVIALAYLTPVAAIVGPLAYARSVDLDLVTVLVGWGLPVELGGVALAAIGVLAVVALLHLVGALYALPVAVALYAHSGRFAAAFDLRTIFAGAASEDYVVAWFVTMLLQLFLLPVAYLLRLLLVGFFLQFLVAVGVRYCYGQGVGDALNLEPVDDPSTTAQRATPAVVPLEEAEWDWR